MERPHFNIAATEASASARESVWATVSAGARSTLVDSPPGAGKSTLVREIARRSCNKMQVPIVVQTNDQADDMVRGLTTDMAIAGRDLVIARLHRTDYAVPEDLRGAPEVRFSSSIADLEEADIVVAPAAKWARIGFDSSWPFAIVDEAYQMRSDALIPIGAMMHSLLMVGDPGQLAPFTTADDSRFRGRPLSPVETAAATLLSTQPETVRLALPVSWRLPAAAADLIADAFYDVAFSAGALPGQRTMLLGVTPLRQTTATKAVSRAAQDGWAYVELDELVMPRTDPEAIETLIEIVAELLVSNVSIRDEYGLRTLQPRDIAVGVSHRDQRDQVRTALYSLGQRLNLDTRPVVVDTANVLQGREFQVVVVWHPLSGRRDASQFHLDAGRLCVLLSRHRHACIVVARGGIEELLASHAPTEPIWLGETAPILDGWHAHLRVLDHLSNFRI